MRQAPFLSFGLFAMLAGPSPAAASSVPDKPNPPVIRISVEMIQLDAVVTDKKGRHVTDLRPDEIQVFQDGELQPISAFSYVRAGVEAPSESQPSAAAAAHGTVAVPAAAAAPTAPRTLLVVLDDLSFNAHSFDRTRRSLRQVIEGLDPKDRVDIVATSSAIDRLTLTTDRKANLAALDAVRRTPWTRGELANVWASPQAAFFGRTHGERYDGSVFDNVDDWMALRSLAVVKEVVKALREIPGRKAILLVSQGFLNLRDLTLPQVSKIYWPIDRLYGDNNDLFGALRRTAELATRSGVVIHTVDPRGLTPAGLSVEDSITDVHDVRAYQNTLAARHVGLYAAQGTLQHLSDETGGLSLVDDNDMARSIDTIVSDLSGYYLIGYTPRSETFDSGRFHRFEVKVKRPGVKVRTREGFYPVTDDQVAAALK
jgi:VWFA-related protein